MLGDLGGFENSVHPQSSCAALKHNLGAAYPKWPDHSGPNASSHSKKEIPKKGHAVVFSQFLLNYVRLRQLQSLRRFKPSSLSRWLCNCPTVI